LIGNVIVSIMLFITEFTIQNINHKIPNVITTLNQLELTENHNSGIYLYIINSIPQLITILSINCFTNFIFCLYYLI